jgi:hypothetical protein
MQAKKAGVAVVSLSHQSLTTGILSRCRRQMQLLSAEAYMQGERE